MEEKLRICKPTNLGHRNIKYSEGGGGEGAQSNKKNYYEWREYPSWNEILPRGAEKFEPKIRTIMPQKP